MMKKIIKDTLSLVMITIIAGVCLSFVHELTADTIAAAEYEERQASYREVFPEAAGFIEMEIFDTALASASKDFAAGVSIGEALWAVNESGNILGCVVSVTSANGYGGDIVLSVGIDYFGTVTGIERTITGMKVTSMSETSGLGSHCTDESFQDQFKGISGEVVYVKDGKTQPNEIDMISGATFTSRAVTEAVNGALRFSHYATPWTCVIVGTGGEAE